MYALQRGRQTGRQTDIQTDRQTDKQTGREREIYYYYTHNIRKKQPEVGLSPGEIVLTHYNNHHWLAQSQLGILKDVCTGPIICVTGWNEHHKNGGIHQSSSHQISRVLVALLREPTVRTCMNTRLLFTLYKYLLRYTRCRYEVEFSKFSM